MNDWISKPGVQKGQKQNKLILANLVIRLWVIHIVFLFLFYIFYNFFNHEYLELENSGK